ncbi:hypothetical protein [Xenorhabdus innexi]|uniref:Uncharacterized protein n=1 Tax=Xenorhabdus innexi TaxID=290109 RepID=A0A1N6MR19_9GAMM|nr:hypothetical protein [Xenorhabdus innexi]PHM36272.1 hypothetical protein Xinn_01806 [Xenorhabdus innexi]SIP71293.1 conserved membrane hypothetical protein [Xenorhabdus innexi]
MKTKNFIFNLGFKKLLNEAKGLEEKLKRSDSEWENINFYDKSYKNYFCLPARFKIVSVFLFIMLVHLSFFFGLAKTIPDFLIDDPNDKIKSVSFISSLILGMIIVFLNVSFTLGGIYYGLIIQKNLNTIILFFSSLIFYLKFINNHDYIYFAFIILSCILIKIILNSQYYAEFILSRIYIRIENINFKKELKKIQGFNKKELREYSREIKLKKRKKIRDEKIKFK